MKHSNLGDNRMVTGGHKRQSEELYHNLPCIYNLPQSQLSPWKESPRLKIHYIFKPAWWHGSLIPRCNTTAYSSHSWFCDCQSSSFFLSFPLSSLFCPHFPFCISRLLLPPTYIPTTTDIIHTKQQIKSLHSSFWNSILNITTFAQSCMRCEGIRTCSCHWVNERSKGIWNTELKERPSLRDHIHHRFQIITSFDCFWMNHPACFDELFRDRLVFIWYNLLRCFSTCHFLFFVPSTNSQKKKEAFAMLLGTVLQ